jgi:hypothetical protein
MGRKSNHVNYENDMKFGRTFKNFCIVYGIKNIINWDYDKILETYKLFIDNNWSGLVALV